jgi:hypothetical protein
MERNGLADRPEKTPSLGTNPHFRAGSYNIEGNQKVTGELTSVSKKNYLTG